MSYTSIVIIVLYNVLTTDGIADLNVKIMSPGCKLSALILFYTVVGILYTPPYFVSTATDPLEI